MRALIRPHTRPRTWLLILGVLALAVLTSCDEAVTKAERVTTPPARSREPAVADEPTQEPPPPVVVTESEPNVEPPPSVQVVHEPQVEPSSPMADLLNAARAARPLETVGDHPAVRFVDLATLDPTIMPDLRYARSDNLMGVPLVDAERMVLCDGAALALLAAHEELATMGLGLVVYDAYRPWYVTKALWDATPRDKRAFVADPSSGSRHNRAIAVDVSLYSLESGEPLEMTSDYDELSERAHVGYAGGTREQREMRDLLRATMLSHGFGGCNREWWHYVHQAGTTPPVLNIPLSALE